MSDQTEKPKGTLPKGYEPNAQGEPQDQDKKIWDKYYNGEIELPDVVKEMKHYRSSEDTELETSDEDRDTVLKAWQRTQNIYGYSQQKAKPKKKASKPLESELTIKKSFNDIFAVTPTDQDQREKYLKEYEKKYLARYKKPKAKPKKLSNLKLDTDLGRLNFRKHAVTKLKKLREERTEYEQKYLARYNKQRKAKPKKKAASSNLYKPEKPKPKRDMKKERTEYEQKYLAQYNKQRKAKSKKKK